MTKRRIVFLPGKKVNLCLLERKDIRQITHWINDSDVTQYLVSYRPMLAEEEEGWYEKLVGSEKNFVFRLESNDSDRTFFGTMGIHGIDYRQGTAGTGALIGNPSYRGKWFGTDAKMTLLYWAFTELNLRKVCSHVLATNPRSKRYLEKTGYREVGCYRKHVLHKGEFVDEYIMEVFKEDFLKIWRLYNKR
ncbi:hypothetical protein COU13_00585 [Candidatus Kaiserbacteria bacterium CG10_big_fil_rev_8_21_14_0_10_43_70]|uniref:N-acetyltransferase domain-containing protein n=1 Tax=Candidatus Kaiserbacteria bacterium CG10_big_fil_rev_8_21_14_0_10_43_70 TaxID=1974605 RepID=A0A2H0UJD7_9BACT|nr:MAG: hypothetical protein COU13_00585 [Candidatus Kaiserbacteria bacterium CG10_big_fil_rev_8_21_14_0_10_43_70]